MTAKEAAKALFENFAYDDAGKPRDATVCEALLMAIWALLDAGGITYY